MSELGLATPSCVLRRVQDSSGLKFGVRMSSSALNLLVVAVDMTDEDRAGLFEYLSAMQMMTFRLRVALLTDEDDLRASLVRGWLTERLWPQQTYDSLGLARPWSDYVDQTIEQRAQTMDAAAILLLRRSRVDRAAHYQLCALLGQRIKWRTVGQG